MDTSFCLHPVILKDGEPKPCGSCPVCRMKYRKQMAVRLYLERSIEKPAYSYFITLTYNDANIPYCSGRQAFNKEHIQTFLDSCKHKLARLGYTQRYFLTCEYGEKGYRPHYHYIVFLYPKSYSSRRVQFSRHQYLHDVVEPLWNKGFCYDGTVSLESIMYCTAYALKDDESLERDWTGFEEGKPFRLFSLRPGLGLTDKCVEFWTMYIYNDGQFRSGMHINLSKRGVSTGIPVGIKRKIKEDNPEFYEDLKAWTSNCNPESVSRLYDNAKRYGSKRDYRFTLSEPFGLDQVRDTTPDEEIKAFRKALREFNKRQRNPLK